MSLFLLMSLAAASPAPYCAPQAPFVQQIQEIAQHKSEEDFVVSLWKRSKLEDEIDHLNNSQEPPDPKVLEEKAKELGDLNRQIFAALRPDLIERLLELGLDSDELGLLLDQLTTLFSYYEDWSSAKTPEEILARAKTSASKDPGVWNALGLRPSKDLRSALKEFFEDLKFSTPEEREESFDSILKIQDLANGIYTFHDTVLAFSTTDPSELTQEEQQKLTAKIWAQKPNYFQRKKLSDLRALTNLLTGLEMVQLSPAFRASLEGKNAADAKIDELIAAVEKAIFPWDCATNPKFCEALGGTKTSTRSQVLEAFMAKLREAETDQARFDVLKTAEEPLQATAAIHQSAFLLLPSLKDRNELYRSLHSKNGFDPAEAKRIAELLAPLTSTPELLEKLINVEIEALPIRSLADLRLQMNRKALAILQKAAEEGSKILPENPEALVIAASLPPETAEDAIKPLQFDPLLYVARSVSADEPRSRSLTSQNPEDRQKEFLLLNVFEGAGKSQSFASRTPEFMDFMKLSLSEIATLAFVRENLPGQPMPISGADFRTSYEKWKGLADRLLSFENFLAEQFQKPPRVFFTNASEFETKSQRLTELIVGFKDLPYGWMEALGWPKSKPLLSFRMGDPSSLKDLIASETKTPTEAPTFNSAEAFIASLEGLKSQISDRKQKLAEALKLDASKFSLLELEAFTEAQKLDPNLVEVLSPGVADGNSMARQALFSTVETQLSQERVIQAIFGKDWLKSAKELAAAPTPKPDEMGPFAPNHVPPDFILRRQYAEKASKAIEHLFAIEEFKRAFGAMNGYTGMGNAPSVQWAYENIQKNIDALIQLGVISDKSDPRLEDLLISIVPRVLNKRDEESQELTTEAKEYRIRSLQQKIDLLTPALMSGSNILPTQVRYSSRGMAEEFLNAERNHDLDSERMMRILVDALSVHETAKVYGSMMGAQSSQTDADAEAKLKLLKNEWKTQVLDKLKSSRNVMFTNYLNDLAYRLFPEKLTTSTRLSVSGAEGIEAQRRGQFVPSSSFLVYSQAPNDQRGFADYLMNRLNSIEVEGRPLSERIRLASKEIRDDSKRALTDWKHMGLPKNPDRSKDPRAKWVDTQRAGYETNWHNSEQVFLTKTFRQAAFSAMRPFEQKRIKSDQVLLNVLDPNLSAEAKAEMRSYFLNPAQGVAKDDRRQKEVIEVEDYMGGATRGRKVMQAVGPAPLSPTLQRLLSFAGLPVNEGLTQRLNAPESAGAVATLEKTAKKFFEAGKTLFDLEKQQGAVPLESLNGIIARSLADPIFKNNFMTWGEGGHHDNPLEFLKEFTDEEIRSFLDYAKIPILNLDLKAAKKQISALRFYLLSAEALFGGDEGAGQLVVVSQGLGLALLDQLPSGEALSQLTPEVAFEKNMDGLENLLKSLNISEASKVRDIFEREHKSGALKNWNEVQTVLWQLIGNQVEWAYMKPEDLAKETEETMTTRVVNFLAGSQKLKSFFQHLTDAEEKAALDKVFTALGQIDTFKKEGVKIDFLNIRDIHATADRLKTQSLFEAFQAQVDSIPKAWFEKFPEITQTYSYVRSTKDPEEQGLLALQKFAGFLESTKSTSSSMALDERILIEVYGLNYRNRLGMDPEGARARALRVSQAFQNLKSLPEKVISDSQVQQLLQNHLEALQHNKKMKDQNKPISEWKATYFLRLADGNKDAYKDIAQSLGLSDEKANDAAFRTQIDALKELILAEDEFLTGAILTQGLNNYVLAASEQGIDQLFQPIEDAQVSAEIYGMKLQDVIKGLNRLVAHEAKEGAEFYKQELLAAEQRSLNLGAMLKVGAESAGHFVYGIGGSFLSPLFTATEGYGQMLGILDSDYLNWAANLDEDGNMKELGMWDPRQFMIGRTAYEAATDRSDVKLYARFAQDLVISVPVAGALARGGMAAVPILGRAAPTVARTPFVGTPLAYGLKGMAREQILLARQARTTTALQEALGAAGGSKVPVGLLTRPPSRGMSRFWDSKYGQSFIQKVAKEESRAMQGSMVRSAQMTGLAVEKEAASEAAKSMWFQSWRHGGWWSHNLKPFSRGAGRLLGESAVFTGAMYGIDSQWNPASPHAEGGSWGERGEAIAASLGQNIVFFGLMGIKSRALGRMAIKRPVAAKVAHLFGTGATWYIYRGAAGAAVRGGEALAYKAEQDWGLDWAGALVASERSYDKLPVDQDGVPIFETPEQSKQWHEDHSARAELAHNAFLLGFMHFQRNGPQGLADQFGRVASKVKYRNIGPRASEAAKRFASRKEFSFLNSTYPSEKVREEQMNSYTMETAYYILREMIVRAKNPSDMTRLRKDLLEPLPGDKNQRPKLLRDYEIALGRRATENERKDLLESFTQVFEKARTDGEAYRLNLARLRDQGTKNVGTSHFASQTEALKKYIEELETESAPAGTSEVAKGPDRVTKLENQGLGSFLNLTYEGRELRGQIEEGIKEGREAAGIKAADKFKTPESFTGLMSEVDRRQLAEFEIQPQPGTEGQQIRFIKGPDGYLGREEIHLDGRIRLQGQAKDKTPFSLSYDGLGIQATARKDGTFILQTRESGHHVEIAANGKIKMTSPQKRVDEYSSLQAASGALKSIGIEVEKSNLAALPGPSSTALVKERRFLVEESRSRTGWIRNGWNRMLGGFKSGQVTERRWGEHIVESIYPDNSVKLTFVLENGKSYSIPFGRFFGTQRYSIDPTTQKVSILDNLGVTTVINAKTGTIERSANGIRIDRFQENPITLDQIYWEVYATRKSGNISSETYAARIHRGLNGILTGEAGVGSASAPKSFDEVVIQFRPGLELMGIDATTTPLSKLTVEELRSAYRKAARKYHPDIYKGADAQEKMAELSKTKEALEELIRLRDEGLNPEL